MCVCVCVRVCVCVCVCVRVCVCVVCVVVYCSSICYDRGTPYQAIKVSTHTSHSSALLLKPDSLIMTVLFHSLIMTVLFNSLIMGQGGGTAYVHVLLSQIMMVLRRSSPQTLVGIVTNIVHVIRNDLKFGRVLRPIVIIPCFL